MPQQQNNDRNGGWGRFTDKVLPPLFVGMCMAVCSVLWMTYNTTQALASKQEQAQRQIDRQEAELAAVRSAYMTRMEVLETIKRIEQQLEIQMLRAGVRSPVRKE